VFSKLREATVSFVMSVSMEQFGSHWTYFREMCLSIFRKTVEKIQVSLKSDRNKRVLYMKTNIRVFF
jgi:hypothetical protein